MTTSQEPIIRLATPDDASALAAFAERTFRETFVDDNRPEDIEQYVSAAFSEVLQRAEIDDTAFETLVFDLEGSIVAYAQLHAAPLPDAIASEYAGAIELRRFYVDRRWHGQGPARQLMAAVEDAAMARQATALWLGVWERNVRAIGFYRKCGFVDAGSHVFMMGSDAQTDRLMVHLLTLPQGRAPERVFTERLSLRRPRLDDADAIFARYAGDGEVTKYVGWPRHQSVAQTRQFLAFVESEWENNPAGPYLIHHRVDGTLLGSTGLSFETPWRAATGYVLARDAWGRGYATEALSAMVDVARTTGVRRLYALCHTRHRASAHVLEKAEFTLEATQRAHTQFPNLSPGLASDVYCYVRLIEPHR